MPTCQLASGTAASALWLLICAWAACSTDAVSVVGTGDTAPTVAALVAVDLTGTLAYVAGGTSLTAVRTADKHSPAAAGKVELPGSASSIIEKGGFVYVAGSTGVYIVDVGDPSALSVVDSHPVAGGCLDVFFDAPSTKLFAACGTSGVLRFNVAPLWKLALTETAAPPAGVASFTSIATFVDPSTGVSRAYVCGAAETLTIYASLDLALVKANAGVACGFVRPAGDGAVMLAAAAGVTWVGPERLDNSVPPKLEPTPVLAAYSSSGATGSTDAQLALGVPQELLVTVSGGGLHVYDIATRFIDVQPTANVPSPGQPMSRAVVRGDWAFVAAGSSGLLVVLLRGTDTVAPMTDVPDTAVPETAVPKTSVPETEVPETRVPETPVPDTKVPDTNVPDTNVPDTSVPDTAVPATNVPDTAVPDTAVPATNVPNTSVPETAVPTTSVPDTNAPDTNVPNTAVPATDVPPTSVPETPTPAVPETPNPPASTGAPGTSDTAVPQLSQTDAPVATQTTSLVPESPAPPTPVPGSAMPDKVQKAAHDAAGTAATVSPMGGRFAVLVGLKCEVDDIDLEHAAPLDFEFSPTRLALGGQGYEQRYFLGAVVGNTALVVGFFLANYAVAYGLRACFGLSFENAVFFSRVPGLTYIAILYLMMGTALSGANLLFFSSGNPVSVVAGLLALGYCVAVPVLMWTRLLRPAVFHGVLQPDARLDPTTAAASPTGKQVKVLTGWRRGAYEFVFGPCVWVRKEGGPDFFVEQYGMFFEQYRGGYQWFSIVELTQAIVLALTSVLKPTTPTTCTVRNVWLTLVLLAFFVSVVRWKPFNSRLDQLVASAMTGMMFLAVLLMSVTLLMHGNPESVSKYFLGGSGFLLFCSAGLALMKGIYDIALYALDIFIGRRRGAFRAARCKDAGWKGDGSLLLHGDEGEELAVAAPYDSDDRSSCCSVGGSGSGSGSGSGGAPDGALTAPTAGPQPPRAQPPRVPSRGARSDVVGSHTSRGPAPSLEATSRGSTLTHTLTQDLVDLNKLAAQIRDIDEGGCSEYDDGAGGGGEGYSFDDEACEDVSDGRHSLPVVPRTLHKTLAPPEPSLTKKPRAGTGTGRGRRMRGGSHSMNGRYGGADVGGKEHRFTMRSVTPSAVASAASTPHSSPHSAAGSGSPTSLASTQSRRRWQHTPLVNSAEEVPLASTTRVTGRSTSLVNPPPRFEASKV